MSAQVLGGIGGLLVVLGATVPAALMALVEALIMFAQGLVLAPFIYAIF